MHKLTLKSKLAAFEAQAKAEGPSFKKTWKSAGRGSVYKKTTQFSQGVREKRSLADLP